MRAFFTGSPSGSLVTIPSIAARFDEGIAAGGFWATAPPANRINQHTKNNFMGWMRLGESLPDRDMRSRHHFTAPTLGAKALFVAPFAAFRTAAPSVGTAAFGRPPSQARLE
ncbi:MAG TPA: hypothetical protein VFO46_16140 [Candidatus Sulfotelmatobacter sp.]|nr:hypothetical protein [Candidatus Sulfotelmatobacter sp.]